MPKTALIFRMRGTAPLLNVFFGRERMRPQNFLRDLARENAKKVLQSTTAGRLRHAVNVIRANRFLIDPHVETFRVLEQRPQHDTSIQFQVSSSMRNLASHDKVNRTIRVERSSTPASLHRIRSTMLARPLLQNRKFLFHPGPRCNPTPWVPPA
jgi:hypothetical protein